MCVMVACVSVCEGARERDKARDLCVVGDGDEATLWDGPRRDLRRLQPGARAAQAQRCGSDEGRMRGGWQMNRGGGPRHG
eukprot:1535828-Rhodomonas_salina.1